MTATTVYLSEVTMLEHRRKIRRLDSIDWLLDRYQDHPSMLRVNHLKNKLKEEKLQDKVFYQSIKEKMSNRSR